MTIVYIPTQKAQSDEQVWYTLRPAGASHVALLLRESSDQWHLQPQMGSSILPKRPYQARMAPMMETTMDPFMARIERGLRQVERVMNLFHQKEEGIDVIIVEGRDLSLDEIDQIVDVQCDAIDAYPGRYVDIQIRNQCEE